MRTASHVRLVFSMVLVGLVGCSDTSKHSETSVISEEVLESVSAYVSPESVVAMTTLEIMELVVTPATNTLWAVENPQTDEDWAELEQAAVATIASAELTADGGAGIYDKEWAAAQTYQALNTAMLNAARDALAAIKAKDLDALYIAGDEMYPPCEACHLQFNPAVVEN